MNGPGQYYAKWNKPVRERQVPYDFTYMWNLINQNKLTNRNRLIYTEKRLTNSYQRGGDLEGWIKEHEEINQKKKKPHNKTTTHRHRQQCGDYQRESGVGEVEEGTGDKWWWKETWLRVVNTHIIYRWCIIEMYTWSLSNFNNQCHPNKLNSIKNLKSKNNPRLMLVFLVDCNKVSAWVIRNLFTYLSNQIIASSSMTYF